MESNCVYPVAAYRYHAVYLNIVFRKRGFLTLLLSSEESSMSNNGKQSLNGEDFGEMHVNGDYSLFIVSKRVQKCVAQSRIQQIDQ
ncbi:hypothetical protein T4A_3501 [Trichinella pseudospiralis]|uniref:Uncharacterized protein n=1 Tax=Trichinella pseudospiralis TaxID=6337 RepID=A0A0V1JFU0_TRIPS|nr:hypothetical protein T4A_3501 [Trichinella pseudospiralis]KRZ33879.1 hypothetical protein T4C_12243 [Trichinella pseudospiralis]